MKTLIQGKCFCWVQNLDNDWAAHWMGQCFLVAGLALKAVGDAISEAPHILSTPADQGLAELICRSV
jgi:hypothetical protein